MRSVRGTWVRYGVAFAATAAGLALRGVLTGGWGDRLPYLTLYPAVLVSAWYGGPGPGLVTLGASALGSTFLWLRPLPPLGWPDPPAIVGLAGFVLMNLAICLLVATLRRARARAEETAGGQEFLARASGELSSSLDYSQTLRALGALVVPAIADWCSIDVAEPDGTVRRLAVACADPTKSQILERAAAYPPDPEARHPRTRVLRSGESFIAPEITDAGIAATTNDPAHREDLRALGYRSAMIVALRARGQTLGALTLATSTSGRRYAAEDLPLAEELARRAALAVDNARLYRDAQEANRLKEEFLATVSHELRTPLQAILTWVAVLRQGRLSPDRTAQALEIMERSGRAQEKLIENLLDVSRIVTGRLRLEPTLVDLATVVCDALDAARPAADVKKLAVELALEPGLGLVAGDRVRLQQVVWNLLSNAVKFTPNGGRIEVRLERVADDARLTVRDTGEGIRPEFLPHVFDAFRQGEAAAQRRHGGLGLGLAIVRRVVELHGGRVAARSAGEGQGAEFVVTLPLAPGAAAAERRSG